MTYTRKYTIKFFDRVTGSTLPYTFTETPERFKQILRTFKTQSIRFIVVKVSF